MQYYKEINTQDKVIFDTCIFMVGVEKRPTNSNYSLASMQKLFLDVLLVSFKQILIHQIVYNELDDETKNLINQYININITLVNDADLIGSDPEYTQIYNEIKNSELLANNSVLRKNQGEVHSLAYACYHRIPYFSSRDNDACETCEELELLKDVTVVGFEQILAFAFKQTDNSEVNKGQKALYKEFCQKKIRQKEIPPTLGEYVGK